LKNKKLVFSSFLNQSWLLIWALPVFLATNSGCISSKRLAYFQNLPTAEVRFTPQKTAYHLQPGDVLKISYTGPDPASILPFSSELVNTSTNMGNPSQNFLTGYSVSDSGTIFLPVLGSILVGNKTLDQVEQLVQTRLGTFVRNATTKVRLVSFKITVLGEVRSPGTIYIYNDVLTLPEALGYAGDMNENADRKSVRILRREQGIVVVRTVDITDQALLGSKDFYLQPNDVVYAVPVRQKATRLNLPVAAIGLSGLTTVLVLLTLLR